MMYVKCDSCDGKGYLGGKTCPKCQGLGKVSAIPRPITVKSKKGKRK
ncbi:MAG: hypothetical protein QUS33_07425 [Dehalococcoidia bacterium]|nr:hypothetical protein [Dehalococcoidia bacterium]